MGIKKKTLNWVNNSNLDVEIVFLDWTNELSYLEAYDYKVIVKAANCTYTGRGISENLELSLLKAVSESIERLISCQIKNNNAAAVHFDKIVCEDIVICELLERHYILSHFNNLSNINFKSISVRKDIDLELSDVFDNYDFFTVEDSIKKKMITYGVGVKDGKVFFSSDCHEFLTESVAKISLVLIANIKNYEMSKIGNTTNKVLNINKIKKCNELIRTPMNIEIQNIDLNSFVGLEECPLFYFAANAQGAVDSYKVNKTGLFNPYRHDYEI